MGFNNSTNNLFREQKVVNSAVNYAALSDDIIINITNTTASRTVTLPAPSSTNIGKFFVVKDISGGASSNNIIVIAASGNIDGSAIHLINSNYGSAVFYSGGTNYFTQSRFSDVVPLVEYIEASLSSNQSISAPVTLAFDTTEGGSIPLASGVFTLNAGKTYILEAHPGFSAPNSGSGAAVQWRNITAGNALFGGIGRTFSTIFSTVGLHSSQSSAVAVITPSVTTRVDLRVLNMSGTSPVALSDSTRAIIREIGSTAQNPLEYIQASLSGNQSISAPTTLTFVNTEGGSIPLASGVFTLNADKTYILEAHPGFDGRGASSITAIQWRNITAGNALFGGIGRSFSTATATGGFHCSQSSAVAIITPSVTTQVDLRVLSMTGTTPIAVADSTRAVIRELGTTIQNPVEHIEAAISSNQSVSAPTTLTFDTIEGGAIPLASGVFTLSPDKTYVLEAHPGFDAPNSASQSSFQWRNITAGNTLFGGKGRTFSSSLTTSGLHSSQSSAVAVITPSVTTQVDLRVLTMTGNSPTALSDSTRVIISQIRPATQNSTTLVSFKALKGASQSIPNTTLTTVVNWSLVIFDVTSGFVSSTGIFTVPRSGRYLCIASLVYTGSVSAGDFFQIGFGINGGSATPTELAQTYIDTTAALVFPTPKISSVLNLSAGDTVQLVTFQSSGGALNVHSDDRFNFFQIQELVNTI